MWFRSSIVWRKRIFDGFAVLSSELNTPITKAHMIPPAHWHSTPTRYSIGCIGEMSPYLRRVGAKEVL